MGISPCRYKSHNEYKNPPLKIDDNQLITISQGMIKKLTEADPGELCTALQNMIETINVDHQGKLISGYITFYLPQDPLSSFKCPQVESNHCFNLSNSHQMLPLIKKTAYPLKKPCGLIG